MIPRHALVAAVACAALLPFAANAAGSSVVLPGAGGAIHRQSPGGPVTRTNCLTGVPGSPAFYSGLYPPNDTYFQLIHPAQCASCSLVTLTAAHVVLRFPSACSVPVEISVLKSTGTACPQPDLSHVICPTFATNLEGAAGDTLDFAVPFPGACQIAADAFLCVNFTTLPDSCSSDANSPKLAVHAGCPRCETYENLDGGGLEDVCQFGFGQPVLYAEIGECILTPNLRKSWGSLRILYR